jgi:hypothetical protein
MYTVFVLLQEFGLSHIELNITLELVQWHWKLDRCKETACFEGQMIFSREYIVVILKYSYENASSA